MPGMDGFETTRAIRKKEDGTGHRVPIIAITAHAVKGFRERCFEAGMDDYLAKPLKREQLFESMNALDDASRGLPVQEPITLQEAEEIAEEIEIPPTAEVNPVSILPATTAAAPVPVLEPAPEVSPVEHVKETEPEVLPVEPAPTEPAPDLTPEVAPVAPPKPEVIPAPAPKAAPVPAPPKARAKPASRKPAPKVKKAPAPPPKATPAPAPEVPPAATPSPPSPAEKATPSTAGVRVTGDAHQVQLVSNGQRISGGRVAPGSYNIEVRFRPGDTPQRQGSLTIAAGETALINCKASFHRCTVRGPWK